MTIPCEVSINPLPSARGKMFFACMRDISKRKALQRALEEQALHDALTGEPTLVDETLDDITRERLNDEIAALFAAEPFAGLFVTHSVRESVFLSTRVLVLSPRPGRVAADIEIPFPYPRSPELRYTSEFAEVTGKVARALREVSS